MTADDYASFALPFEEALKAVRACPPDQWERGLAAALATGMEGRSPDDVRAVTHFLRDLVDAGVR